MKEADRFATDDITWCMAECSTDCPRQPRYIRDKLIPHPVQWHDDDSYCKDIFIEV